MREKVLRFGPNDCLLGILTEPAAETRRADAPAILFFNAGTLHHVGPYGWFVTLARRLAQRGYTVLRFDFSGQGDSSPRSEPVPSADKPRLDMSAAMDALQRRLGIERFVLFGLCSGALDAHATAVLEPRVVAAVLLDGYAYRTWGFYRRLVLAKLFRLRSWQTLMRKCIGALAQRRGVQEAPQFAVQPPRLRGQQELRALAQRGVRLLLIYTGELANTCFNAHEQLAEMFPDLAHEAAVQVAYHPRADHMYANLGERAQLFQLVETWLEELP